MELTEAQRKQVDKVREEIWFILCDPRNWDNPHKMDDITVDDYHLNEDKAIDQILSKLVILDDDQNLPEIKHEVCSDEAEQLARDHYEAGWNNGVNKAYRLGFRRIISGRDGE